MSHAKFAYRFNLESICFSVSGNHRRGVFGNHQTSVYQFNKCFGHQRLNWIFLILTLIKAYGIAWYFMHLRDEKTWFRRAIVWPVVFLISYLAFFLLYEGGALGDHIPVNDKVAIN